MPGRQTVGTAKTEREREGEICRLNLSIKEFMLLPTVVLAQCGLAKICLRNAKLSRVTASIFLLLLHV